MQTITTLSLKSSLKLFLRHQIKSESNTNHSTITTASKQSLKIPKMDRPFSIIIVPFKKEKKQNTHYYSNFIQNFQDHVHAVTSCLSK